MLLAVDAGNTNVVFALVDGGQIAHAGGSPPIPRRTADEYAVWLHQLLQLEGLGPRRGRCRHRRHRRARALHNLEVLASKYFGTEALVAGRAPV